MQTPPIPIEDDAGDVVSKAQSGLHFHDDALALDAGVSLAQLHDARNGDGTDAVWRSLARPLELDATALVALARRAWYPPTPPPADGFARFNTPFGGDMSVNNYLLWDCATGDAALFDTGTDGTDALSLIRKRKLRLRDIFITHTHADHIAALESFVRATGAVVHVSEREPPVLAGAVTFADGTDFAVGGLRIKTLDVCGHSPGQTAFFVNGGGAQATVISGDALFADSMGKSLTHYREQRRNTAERILALPEDTVIAPGHGPLTTVGFEKKHNPVFVAFF
ncbi:MAG: MBL fold metallo-hydrolase [Puniceicoccales bacterium]|jgi:glyoxylase-like metal-dependent hydrolase (beta-lactamase superfamily II)|nr:MBL fold metallo-hydrolase [Puniceicoccales bacterium]